LWYNLLVASVLSRVGRTMVVAVEDGFTEWVRGYVCEEGSGWERITPLWLGLLPSKSHVRVYEMLFARWAWCCYSQPNINEKEWWIGIGRKEGHLFAMRHWILQIWEWPRYDRGDGQLPCGRLGPTMVETDERAELSDGCQLVVLDRRQFLFERFIGFVMAGKYECSRIFIWRDASKLSSFSWSSWKMIDVSVLQNSQLFLTI